MINSKTKMGNDGTLNCIDCGESRYICDDCRRCIFCADEHEGEICTTCAVTLLRFTRDWRDKWRSLSNTQDEVIRSFTKMLNRINER